MKSPRKSITFRVPLDVVEKVEKFQSKEKIRCQNQALVILVNKGIEAYSAEKENHDN